MIRLDRIRPDPSQPRRQLDTDAQRELVASVKRLGLLQPISVRYLAGEDTYQIISGERRYQVAKQLGRDELPCCVQNLDAMEVLLRRIAWNWQRADGSPCPAPGQLPARTLAGLGRRDMPFRRNAMPAKGPRRFVARRQLVARGVCVHATQLIRTGR